MTRACVDRRSGDKMEFFDNAAKALGIVFMHFESRDEMHRHLSAITEEIEIVLD